MKETLWLVKCNTFVGMMIVDAYSMIIKTTPSLANIKGYYFPEILTDPRVQQVLLITEQELT